MPTSTGRKVRTYEVRRGRRYPLGATFDDNGANFAIWSWAATKVELLLFERADSPQPFQIIRLDEETNRSFFCWHVYVVGLRQNLCYGWRIDGPGDTPRTGHRFDREKVLLDPAARAVMDLLWNRQRAIQPGDNCDASIRAILVDEDNYDWEGDRPLDRPAEGTIIYEMHVGGFTRHPNSGVAHPGTFAGVIEKIPYLKDLGITDVELMPTMAFDEQCVPEGAATRGLKNYWGYSTHSFFAPHPGYSATPHLGAQIREFRDMVKALHKAGIGIIMDVAFNHTAEGGGEGPTINFKGFGNSGFYHLEPHDRSLYRDFTGCGNTVNCSHPVISRFIIDCLEYWVREMHVDGFRFDLASVFARDMDGVPKRFAPTPWLIEFSHALARTKIIAEAWDAAGLYQVGGYPGYRWAEWNGMYRDAIRRFVRGEKGIIGEVATRLVGSSDLYGREKRLPSNSINFITCHDGFTVNDLVSYNEKHNEGNGDDNQDGSNDNLSWNCGIEGETNDDEVISLRRRQAKNLMAILLLSQGVPMLLYGDEVLRTQKGNNNAYCQDNGVSWFDWDLANENSDMLRFVRAMISFRRRHPCLMHNRFLKGTCDSGAAFPDVTWHGIRLHEPAWGDSNAQVLTFTLGAVAADEEDLHIILNMSEEDLNITLPDTMGRSWCCAVDTARPSPADVVERDRQFAVAGDSYRVTPRSVIVFERR
jgi:glycogen operon protein